MMTLPSGPAEAVAPAAAIGDEAGVDDSDERPTPSGGRALPLLPPVMAAEPGVSDDATDDVARSPAPQKRHAVDGRHCDQFMLAVATAATTMTRMTPTAIRPALLEWITMLIPLRKVTAETLPNAEVIGVCDKSLAG
jgi:hypothetical protein